MLVCNLCTLEFFVSGELYLEGDENCSSFSIVHSLNITCYVLRFCLMPILLFLQIINSDNVQEAARETDGYFIKSGIVTIIKDALVPSGTII